MRMKSQQNTRRQFLAKVVSIGGSAGVCGLAGGSFLTSPECKAMKQIELSNDHLSVTIDLTTGTITALHNKLTDERQLVNSVEFGIVSDRGTISSDQMQMSGVRAEKNH